ncbi:MAG: hypothetical protein EWM73_01386 [Nitrospira sp.]|nr:MAG: hypothetical protein EWM73_01386 [Nitrospira sp.]
MAASWGGGRFRGSLSSLFGLSGLFRVATQLNKPKKPDEPNKRDEPASRHAPRDLGLQDPQSLAPGSLFASTSNETNKNHHDRDDQEGMNESAHGVRGDNTQKPEDNHDDCDGLEHVASPFVIPWPIVRLAAHCRLTDKSSGATREAEQGSLSNLLCASLLRSPRRIYHSVDDVRALCEGRRIQRQCSWFVWFIWFISFISFSEPDKPKKPDRPDEPAPRHAPRNGFWHIINSRASSECRCLLPDKE